MSVASWAFRQARRVLPDSPRWLGLAVAAGLILSLPIGLSDAAWPVATGRLWFLTALAAFWALLWVQLARRPVFFFLAACVGGMGIVGQIQGRVLPPLAVGWQQAGSALRWLVANATNWAGRHLPVLAKAKLPPSTSFLEWAAAWDRLRQFGLNLSVGWPINLSGRHWQRESLLVATLLMLVFWLAVSALVWLIAERRPWAALAGSLAVLAVNTAITVSGWTGLGVALGCGLLLAAFERLEDRLDRWGTGALPYGVETEWRIWSLVFSAFAAAALAGMVTLTDPQFYEDIREFFERDDDVARESSAASAAQQEASPGVWPRQHLLGAGPDLSQRPVMTVSTPGMGPGRFYWRATSYDIYTGHGWRRQGASQIVTGGNLLAASPDDPPPGLALLRQSVLFENPNDQIYAAGTPVRLSQSVEVFWLADDLPDLVTVQGLTPLYSYEALSWVPAASADDLRADAGEYPEWVVERYTRLPDELPDRVAALAERVVAEEPAAYDQALALQAYLRGYPYTLDLPAPPEESDVADYFLFDLRTGYCDYYATAMVVMARSLGLPARLAAGYASGEYDAESGVYHVTAADAHSWPEIYFPSVGWVPFEPTAGRPALTPGSFAEAADLPAAVPPEQIVAEFEEAAAAESASSAPRPWGWWAAGGGLMLLLAVTSVTIWLRRRRLAQLPPDQLVDALYRRLVRHGERLGVPLSPTQTPAEFHAALIGELERRRRTLSRDDSVWQARYALVERGADRLCGVYADRLYSRWQPDSLRALAADWYPLSRALWWVWLGDRAPLLAGGR